MLATQQKAEVLTPGTVQLTIGQTKRALEWWSCSERFRQLIAIDPERAGLEFNLGFNPEIIRPLWDAFYAQDAARDNRELHPAVHAYREFFNSKTRWRTEVKQECSPDEPRFAAWRARQIARNSLENGAYDDYIIHTPMAIEITDGCSVGCWFCGVGATKLVEAWQYTEENARLWRGVVSVLREKIGNAAKWGFCYWATDPLDNPDYEHFALDFHAITGMFPQTTTAQGHKDPDRIRRILAMSQQRGCRVNRFSVLTEPLLRQIYENYSADELTQVEIVAQMREGTVPKAAAGAFRELAKTKKNIVDLEQKKLRVLSEKSRRLAGEDPSVGPPLALEQPGTIACVSGFLLNMVKRSVKLIAPCRASDTWPLGYIVFDERRFTDENSLRDEIEDMMVQHMPLSVEPEDPIRLNPGFTYERVEDGFNVITPMTALGIQRADMREYVQSIGEQLWRGEKTAAEIAFSAFFEHGVPEVNTLSTLALLFDKGLLMDAKGRTAGGHVQ